MNYPFKFTFTGSGTEYGILWNPWGTTPPATAVVNAILTGLADPVSVCLLPPTGTVELQGFAAMVDSTGNGACTIGYYDTDTTAFVALYPVLATGVPGGGITRDMKDGVHLPLSATRIPCIRYDGSGGTVLTGDLHVILAPPSTNADGSLTWQVLLDESGAAILDESGNPLYAN